MLCVTPNLLQLVNRNLRYLSMLCAIFSVLCACFVDTAVADSQTRQWLRLKMGIISPAAIEMLDGAVQQAEQGMHSGIIIQLDTPGGALEATRKVVQKIYTASVPVVVWVAPGGAHAGSAGAFITMAATVAAMSPGTNIGAAHPVQADGKDIDAKIKAKIVNDTVAFIESVAEFRGRNKGIARSFVLESISITEKEALEQNVIDIIASTSTELLVALDGRIVEQNGKTMTIASIGGEIVDYQPSLRQRFLELLGNPNLFYLLFTAGMAGIGLELMNPGLLFPGILGAICLLLALIASSVLPVSFGAAGLMLLGIVLLIAEIYVTSFGLLAIGGLTAFIAGSVFLVDPANIYNLRVAWYTIAPSAIMITALVVILGYLTLRTLRSGKQSGTATMLGKQATVVDSFSSDGKGKVKVSGEIWNAVYAADSAAESPAPLPNKGDTVIIRKVDGLLLYVGIG